MIVVVIVVVAVVVVVIVTVINEIVATITIMILILAMIQLAMIITVMLIGEGSRSVAYYFSDCLVPPYPICQPTCGFSVNRKQNQKLVFVCKLQAKFS